MSILEGIAVIVMLVSVAKSVEDKIEISSYQWRDENESYLLIPHAWPQKIDDSMLKYFDKK